MASRKPVPLTYLNLASPVADRALDQDLTPTFATNLDALMEDAQQHIGTGLEILPYLDRASIKPGGDQDYWRAQQGQRKVRIRYQGQSLSKAPSKVQDWLADNVGPYGLFMPVGSTAADSKSPETRIADGFDRVLVASLDSPSSRALGPSAKQMEQAVSAIDNPDLQEATRANLQINLDRQSKQDKAGQLNASRELWAAIDDGKSLEDVPISIRVAAGSATLADATNFIRTREGGKIIQTDAVTLSELNRMMASNPDRFAGQDLDAYRNQISRNDLQDLKQHQADLLKQDSQALKRTEIYKATFEQADQLLHQLGRSSIGPNGEIDPEVSRLNAQFFVNLKALIDHEWAKGSFDAAEPGLLQSLIQKQLAADLQALQEVTSSVSTSDAVAGPMPEGIKLPSMSGIGTAAKRAGLAIVSAPAALLAGAFVLAGTKSAGGEDINESFDLGDYGSLNVTGHGSAPIRTLTITAPDGSKTIITGRLEQDENGPRHFTLKSGTIEDRAMTPGELRYFSSILSGKNVNAVYSESAEDGEEGKPTRPADKEQQDIEFAVAEGGALATTPNSDPDDGDKNDPEDKKTIKKRVIEWAGKAIKTLPAQVVSRAILLATTLPAGEGIDETFELKDGGEVSITGQDLDRTLTFKTVSGDEIIITGRQILHPTGPGYLSLSGGTINGEAMSESELQDASGMLSDNGVSAAFEEAETQIRPTNEQALDRLRTVIDAAILETDEAKGLQMISEALKEHEPYLIDKAVPRVHPNVEPSMNPQTYMDFHKIIGENHSGLGRPQPGKGSIEGMPEAHGSNDDETLRSLVREEDIAFIMKELGYKIEWKPDIESEDDLDFNKDPDYRINGHIYDCYAPISDKVRNIWKHIKVHKIENGQTKRVILYLKDSPVTIQEVLKQFKQYPISGMLDLIIVK